MSHDDIYARELEHHEVLYSGEAQRIFRQPAVRALRRHMVGHILQVSQAQPHAEVLSLGCGIGDTELLLGEHVSQILAVDLSPRAIAQARADADAALVRNVDFQAANFFTLDLPERSFDLIIAVFFLHHLPDDDLPRLAQKVARWLRPGGTFWSLDPNRLRLSGFVGQVLVPHRMKKYQTPDEKPLDGTVVRAAFERAGLRVETGLYDFVSSPLAGLLPGAARSYTAARLLDDLLVRIPGVRRFGSNLEVIARLTPPAVRP